MCGSRTEGDGVIMSSHLHFEYQEQIQVSYDDDSLTCCREPHRAGMSNSFHIGATLQHTFILSWLKQKNSILCNRGNRKEEVTFIQYVSVFLCGEEMLM